jgi:hypothetical protein
MFHLLPKYFFMLGDSTGGALPLYAWVTPTGSRAISPHIQFGTCWHHSFLPTTFNPSYLSHFKFGQHIIRAFILHPIVWLIFEPFDHLSRQIVFMWRTLSHVLSKFLEIPMSSAAVFEVFIPLPIFVFCFCLF